MNTNMLKYDYIIGIDPSGAYREGKGTTGIAILNCRTDHIDRVDTIKAKDFTSDVDYWQAHIDYLNQYRIAMHKTNKTYKVVIEDYLLYAHKADAQINSRMETSQLLGALKIYLNERAVDFEIRTASVVKKRWANPILLRKGYIVRHKGRYQAAGRYLENHTTDAIRHAVHEHIFYNVEKSVHKAVKDIKRLPKLMEETK